MVTGTVELTPAEVLVLRMRSLLLAPGSRCGGAAPDDGPPVDVAGVVTWFGAMQAQDMASGLWSLGVRLPGFTRDDVNAALESREALRTWPMRGTVHLVPSCDARWMLEVLGARPLAGAAARRAFLGLSQEAADRAADALGTALAGGGRLTRAECLQTIVDAGIDCKGQLGYHLLWYASQRGVICIAPHVGTEQTFALLDEWAPGQVRPERDEALGIIALRYFRSHGPTTRQDFAGWTGLTAVDAKRGIAVAGRELASVRVEGQEMFVHPALLDGERAAHGGGMLALPGFDEYLLGFKDRSLMVAPEHKDAIIPGGNGMFQSTIVRAGRVVGTWKRTVAKTRITVDVLPLVRLGSSERELVEGALEPYSRFTASQVQVRWGEETG